MVNHLKRGKALRERLPLTALVSYVSQTSLKADTSDASRDPWTPDDGDKGARGQPVLSSGHSLGSRKERKGQGEKHATYSLALESSMLNTGSFCALHQAA
jgi:hypothetical protein